MVAQRRELNQRTERHSDNDVISAQTLPALELDLNAVTTQRNVEENQTSS